MPALTQAYQPIVQVGKSTDAYQAAALVGINSVCMGWSVREDLERKDLLGFSIRRSEMDPLTGEELSKVWLSGNKRFPFQLELDKGPNISSFEAPFQRFNWNDYALNPARHYRYEIIPFRGNPKQPMRLEPMVLDIVPSATHVNGLGIMTNRGVSSANAYLDRFNGIKPQDSGPAQVWLSRGLKESLVRFINRAVAKDALHIAIYEFEDHDIAAALKGAKDRGAEIKIVHHGKPKQVEENNKVLQAYGLLVNAVPRSNVPGISHNKYTILLKNGAPKAVWTGTCNYTFNGFYLQTNMALELDHAATAAAFEAYFQILQRDPKMGGKANPARREIEALIKSTDQKLADASWKLRFSPISKVEMLEQAAAFIRNAQSAVFVSAPFALDQHLRDALMQNDPKVIEYGLSNTTVKKQLDDLNFRNTRFFVPSRLETHLGQKWDAPAFGNHKIHSKSLVIDPWSDNPKVIIGTGNFSDEACLRNDENFLIAEGDSRLAAIVGTEFIRMWEHYKNRAFINDMIAQRGMSEKQNLLLENGSWANTAFNPNSPSYKFRERQVFVGQV